MTLHIAVPIVVRPGAAGSTLPAVRSRCEQAKANVLRVTPAEGADWTESTADLVALSTRAVRREGSVSVP